MVFRYGRYERVFKLEFKRGQQQISICLGTERESFFKWMRLYIRLRGVNKMKLLNLIQRKRKPPTIAELKAMEAAFIMYTENNISKAKGARKL
jgi:hypothetical protein